MEEIMHQLRLAIDPTCRFLIDLRFSGTFFIDSITPSWKWKSSKVVHLMIQDSDEFDADSNIFAP